MKNYNLKAYGGGVGLRHAHFKDIIEKKPELNWFEIINEDFMNRGGWEREALREIRKHYPIIGHGVCLSIGSTDPLDLEYLADLKKFLHEIKSPWTSDHLCFTMVDHTNLNDLIPVPFTDEAVKNIVERVRVVKDVLELPFMLENVTRYITVSDREMSESAFINRILDEADCGLLLDVTNVYLNSRYHKFDPFDFIQSLPLERVGQYHLSGFQIEEDGSYIDSHDAEVPDEVWELFEKTIQLTGPSSVLVEWDKSLPPIEDLVKEAKKIDQHVKNALGSLKAA